MFRLCLAFIFLCPNIAFSIPEIHEYRYSYGGNNKGLISYPETGSAPYPVIIYNYDHYYDKVGHDLAMENGYDLEAIMREFNRWGYVCMVPLHRNGNVKSIVAALKYAYKNDIINHANVNILAQAEGAFLTLFAVQNYPDLKSMTLISPYVNYHKGYYSVPNMIRLFKTKSIPTFYVMNLKTRPLHRKTSQIVYDFLKSHNMPIQKKIYNESREYFWKVDNDFMKEYHVYLTGNPYPIIPLRESK